jgi:hypothetical protein
VVVLPSVCLIVCDLEISTMRRPRIDLGCWGGGGCKSCYWGLFMVFIFTPIQTRTVSQAMYFRLVQDYVPLDQNWISIFYFYVDVKVTPDF